MGRSGARAGLAGALVAALACATVATGALARVLVGRGIDVSDEGMYLNAMANPSDAGTLFSLYGHAYHPLYAALGEDLVALRTAGLVLSVGLGSLLVWSLLDPAVVKNRIRPVARAVISVATGMTALLMLVHFPMTPSYNTLSLQGATVLLLGFGVTIFRSGRWADAGWALMGAGLSLTFLAKATTAAAFLVVLVVALVILVGSGVRRGWISVVSGLATLSIPMFAAGQGPLALGRVLAHGYAATKALGTHSLLLRWDAFPYRRIYVIFAALVIITTWGTALLLHRHPVLAGLAFSLGSLLTVAAVWRWDRQGALVRAGDHLPFLLLGVVAAVASSTVANRVLRHAAGDTLRAARDRRFTVLLVVLVLAPVLCAFGSTNNYWKMIGKAALFWAVAATVLAARSSGERAVGPAWASIAFTVLSLLGGGREPYKTTNLFEARVPTVVDVRGSVVSLSQDQAERRTRLLEAGRDAGIQPETWFIDLTGYSPGWVWAWGGHAVGEPWLIGGQVGSNAAAQLALSSAPCQARSAWVLAAPTKPLSISPDALDVLGLDLTRDYELVDTLRGVAEPRSWKDSTIDDVLVYRPKAAPLAVRGCAP